MKKILKHSLLFIALICHAIEFQASVQDKFVQAIDKDDLEGVRSCIDQGAQVNGDCSVTLPDRTGKSQNCVIKMTPLTLAASKGNLSIVTLLCDKGADVNSCGSENKSTPLMRAIISLHDNDNSNDRNRNEIIDLFLDKGARIEPQDALGRTALHYAMYANKIQLARQLLTRHPEQPIEGTPKSTMFHFLLFGNHYEAIIFLIRACADQHIEDGEHVTIFNSWYGSVKAHKSFYQGRLNGQLNGNLLCMPGDNVDEADKLRNCVTYLDEIKSLLESYGVVDGVKNNDSCSIS